MKSGHVNYLMKAIAIKIYICAPSVKIAICFSSAGIRWLNVDPLSGYGLEWRQQRDELTADHLGVRLELRTSQDTRRRAGAAQPPPDPQSGFQWP